MNKKIEEEEDRVEENSIKDFIYKALSEQGLAPLPQAKHMLGNGLNLFHESVCAPQKLRCQEEEARLKQMLETVGGKLEELNSRTFLQAQTPPNPHHPSPPRYPLATPRYPLATPRYPLATISLPPRYPYPLPGYKG